MASLPRLSPRAEHRILKRVCGLSPRTQRRLFGAPPTVDGQTLASDTHALIKMAELAESTSFLAGMGVAEARAHARLEARATDAQPPIPMARVEELAIPGQGGPIAGPALRPRRAAPGAPVPLLVFFHGGGWVIGDLDTHDGVCRFLAAAAGRAVLAIDYRLAPEHPFPAAVEDAWAAFAWAVDQRRRARRRPGAGSPSAATAPAATWPRWSCLLARGRAAAPTPAIQLLIYPADRRGRGQPSRRLFAEGFLLTRADMDTLRGPLPAAGDRRRRPARLDPAGAGPRRPASRLRRHRRLRPAARRGRGLRAAACARPASRSRCAATPA